MMRNVRKYLRSTGENFGRRLRSKVQPQISQINTDFFTAEGADFAGKAAKSTDLATE